MKIKFSIVFILIFCSWFLISLFNFVPTYAQTETKDQYYSGADTGNDDMENLDNFPMTQSFIPKLDNITKIRLEFAGSGTVPSWIISINDLPGNRLKEVRGEIKNGWVDFVLDSAFSVTPGTTYKIEVQQCGFTELAWVYTQPGSYAKGQAETGMPVSTKDYHFETYGYSSSSGDSRDNENQISDSTDEEADSNIEPPLNLEAEIDSSGKCILLSWDALENSSAMLRLIILRSTNGTDYKEITSISGNSTESKDCEVVVGTKYYYKIRTADMVSESSDSKIAQLTLSQIISTWVYWGISGGVFLILIITYLILAKQKSLWPFKKKFTPTNG